MILLFSSFNIFADELSEQLKEAESIKSTQPVIFANLLKKISNKKAKLTYQQKSLFNYLRAYQLAFMGKANEALPILEEILSSDANETIKFRSRITMINFYAYDQNWTEGLSHLTILLNMLPKINEQALKQNGLALAAMFYNQLGQFSLGLKYAGTLEDIAILPRQICMAKMFKAEALFNTSQKLTPLMLESAMTACKNEPIAENLIRSYIAETQIINNNITDGKQSLLNNLTIIESTKYARLIARTYSLIAKAFFLEGNIEKSKSYALKAIAIAKNIPTTKEVIESHKIIYDLSKLISDYKLALEYHRKYAQLKETYTNKETAKHLAFQLAEHNAFEQESQIKLLNEQNNALAAEQALANTQANNRKLIILLLALIILVFAFFGARLWRAHKRVRQLAEYDPLTGIFNRGHFTQVTNSALKYCKNAEQDLSLIMFDLDHFKKVNDTFGHACGDWALKETIKVCKDIGRQNDIFARLGGEEFCLVLPSCNIDAAMLRAEACRAAIEAIITEESKHDFTITASFGVTDVKRSGFNLDKLLADADMAAYDSKHSGRNRVTIHQVPEKKVEPLDNSWSL